MAHRKRLSNRVIPTVNLRGGRRIEHVRDEIDTHESPVRSRQRQVLRTFENIVHRIASLVGAVDVRFGGTKNALARESDIRWLELRSLCSRISVHIHSAVCEKHRKEER